MIRADKVRNANYALHGVLIKARFMANQEDASPKQIATLLDAAEYLPQLIDSRMDETETFRKALAEIAERYQCRYVLQRFDDPMPERW